jgi:transposase
MSGTRDVAHGNETLTCPFCSQKFENIESLQSHRVKEHSISAQTQYDRLSQDCRQVHNIIWGSRALQFQLLWVLLLLLINWIAGREL